jgi:multiple sugar transport system permease protein
MGIGRRRRWGWYFVLPAVLFFALFSYSPMASSFAASFHQKDILSLRAPKFVAFQNFADTFTSPDVLNSIKATAIVSGVVSATSWLLLFDPRGLANQRLNFLAGNPSPTSPGWRAFPSACFASS